MNRFGLIGFPLNNSFSANLFNKKFKQLGLADFVYQNFEIENSNQLTELLQQHRDIKGLNVTIPHKQSIIPFLTTLDETAAAVNAVNCIQITKNELIGYNTDVIGFEQSLLPLIVTNNPKKALILGTGGAAKAVGYVLRKHNIQYTQVSRAKTANTITYHELTKEILSTHLLIVNCTPLGMFPYTQFLPAIPYAFISNKHIAYDLIYTPEETLFLTQCKNEGAVIKNGLEMLHLQAEKSWEIWKLK